MWLTSFVWETKLLTFKGCLVSIITSKLDVNGVSHISKRTEVGLNYYCNITIIVKTHLSPFRNVGNPIHIQFGCDDADKASFESQKFCFSNKTGESHISKICLSHYIKRLKKKNFSSLLDSQWWFETSLLQSWSWTECQSRTTSRSLLLWVAETSVSRCEGNI